VCDSFSEQIHNKSGKTSFLRFCYVEKYLWMFQVRRFKFLTTIILCLGFALPTLAQKMVSGRIIDASTQLPVLYAAVRYGSNSGTTSDTSGYFSIPLSSKVGEIQVNILGYQPQKIKLDTVASLNNIIIKLEPSSMSLSNITIKPPKRKKREIDTVAMYVLKKVQEHKDENNPRNITSYRLKEHTKLVLSLQKVSPKLLNGKLIRPIGFFFDTPDSNAAGELRYPLLVQEEFNETFHQASPQLNRKVVSYRKISGLKSKYLANLAADQFENIDLYNDVYNIGQLAFTSPFASSARTMYAYYIMDTVRSEAGTSYELAFVAKNKADVALKGYAIIDSATWGVRSIQFKPNEKANINYITDYTVRQNYVYVDGRWLLEEERLSITANVFEDREKLSIHIGKFSIRDDIQADSSIPDSVKQAKGNLLVNAFDKPKSYIDSVRISPLERGEEHIYWAYDTVKTIPAYKRMKWTAHLFATGHIKAGAVEFGRLDEIISRNATEGYRLKIGMRTNEMLSNRIFLGAHLAYGFDVKNLSFLNEMTVRPKGKYERWQSLTFIDQYDMMALGRGEAMFGFDHLFTLFTPASRLNRVIAYSKNGLTYERDWFRGLSSTFQFLRTRYYSVPGKYAFADANGKPLAQTDYRAYTPGAFGVTELSGDIRFSKNSQCIERHGKRVFTTAKHPVFYFKYTLAIKGLLSGDYTYSKLEAQIKHTLQMPLVGYANINFKAGYIIGKTPFTSAFAAPGNPGFVKENNSFELVRPFEFLQDRYLMLFYEHHFQGLLFNHIPYVNRAKLREFVSVKALYGSYNRQNQSLALFPETHVNTKLPYLELGVGVENILKIFQVSFHVRTTYWNTPGAENFAVKIGIKPGF
jgi:hypothetical protein